MPEKHWAYFWHQAITEAFLKGRPYGKNRTASFMVEAPFNMEKVRLRLSNRHGDKPYSIGSLTVSSGGRTVQIPVNGKKDFEIPVNTVLTTDGVEMEVKTGDKVTIRLYYTSYICDNNMIEEEANWLKGDKTDGTVEEALNKPFAAKLLGAYNEVPAIEAAEGFTSDEAKAIVAFGDSITALSRWTRPLSKRIIEKYQGEYVLLNSGIAGNCLLYEPEGIFAPVFGKKGTERFAQDVLEIPGLDTVIFGLGVNDVSYLSDKTASVISLEEYQKAVTKIAEELKKRRVRVVIQTVSPRLGVARKFGKYDMRMEQLRLKINEWIRGAGIFDYVYDAEKVVAQKKEDGLYYGDGLHQGDHLHPDAKGGQKLADAYDLGKLTGKGE